MKLSVIALDYDGTVTRNDALGPMVRAAIAVARREGTVVLLVTGRILEDLRRVAGGARTLRPDGCVRSRHAWR